ncbi:lytic transglycosylase domain-containing protein [Fervidibacillus halotolerans]|uniref:Lytic transglycosylase domain-containing protein n=1 Tax=Fervidibacillus halotolerans TaxID=2980027 RepID=A0A9E8M086_9BACI|nr:lytic transglycosylase domain-containing protein [Fervidibacillus halotolerans]WAA13073.1 lytic transglycosylase domain-containing protein [Fervidibacillus halotolerans]
MNVQQIRTLLEIQAIKNIGSNGMKEQEIGTQTNFSELLNLYLHTKKEIDKEPMTTSIPNIPTTHFSPIAPTLRENTNYQEIIREAALTYQLPERLIYAVIKNESNFNPYAESPSGARGLMQLMPSTAESLGVKSIYDPKDNIMGGAKYLRMMLDRFNRLDLALAAYNAGPGNVEKYGGIPPFNETVSYVKKVMNDFLA